MPELAWTMILFVLPHLARMTDVCHCIQPLVEMESPGPFPRAGLEP
jgi:hypothetical protein